MRLEAISPGILQAHKKWMKGSRGISPSSSVALSDVTMCHPSSPLYLLKRSTDLRAGIVQHAAEERSKQESWDRRHLTVKQGKVDCGTVQNGSNTHTEDVTAPAF